MKKILLFSLLSLFIFSCSEYSDDGTPSLGDNNIVITNPDGTKKVRKITENLIAENSLNDGFLGTNMGMRMTLNSVVDYAQDSYSFISTVETSTEFIGLPSDLEEEEFDTNVTITTSNTVVNGLTTEINSTTELQGQNLSSQTTFEYNENNFITHIQSFEEGSLMTNATIAYNDNNVVVSKEYTDEELGDETMTINFANNMVTDGTITNSLNSNTVTFEFIRNGINITQINLNSGNTSSQINYTYDNQNNFLNGFSNGSSNERLALEIMSCANGTYQPENTSEELNLFNLEASLRGVTNVSENNLTQVTFDGETTFSREFTYDNDSYANAFTSTSAPPDGLLDFGSMFDAQRETLIEQYIAFGMSEEEATAAVNQMLLMFDNLEFDADLSGDGTILYYE